MNSTCSSALAPDHIQEITFTERQAFNLDVFSRHLAQMGSPQVTGVQMTARQYAASFSACLTVEQRASLSQYAEGHLAALLFSNMQAPDDIAAPRHLPPLKALEEDMTCLYLAARNQLLLCLTEQTAFAFDLDNESKIVRLVGNFKGGGTIPREDEHTMSEVEFSSHAGLGLAPHTEAPYTCSVQSCNGHSPAPSTLILSARWNPQGEPTCIVPLGQILEAIGVRTALALTSRSFEFTRSDSFVPGKGESSGLVSILEFDHQGGFAIRYNDYRFSVTADASPLVKEAFFKFQNHVRSAAPIPIILQPSSAVLINNNTALHCRNIVKDNGRLLIRLFGYSKFARPIALCIDPLLVKG